MIIILLRKVQRLLAVVKSSISYDRTIQAKLRAPGSGSSRLRQKQGPRGRANWPLLINKFCICLLKKNPSQVNGALRTSPGVARERFMGWGLGNLGFGVCTTTLLGLEVAARRRSRRSLPWRQVLIIFKNQKRQLTALTDITVNLPRKSGVHEDRPHRGA